MPSPEFIIRWFTRLTPNVSIRIRPTFPDNHPGLWYVCLRDVVIGHEAGGCLSHLDQGGLTPDRALVDAWDAYQKALKVGSPHFAIRYQMVPGMENDRQYLQKCKQAWVWCDSRGGWTDLSPTPEILSTCGVDPSLVLPLRDPIFWPSR